MAVRAVFLVGFMACGKSSLGQHLARRLDWDFVDLDALIEARERQSIAGVFRDRGESGFRVAEMSALRDLTESLKSGAVLHNNNLRGTVVALGGGTFAQSANRELLRSWTTVFLDAPLDELWQRSQDKAAMRPLRKDRTEFDRLHQERLPVYRQATVTVVTSGKDPATLCAEIERSLHFWGKANDGNTNATDSSATSPDDFETGETN